jgi:hypothetical protein
MHVPQHKCNVKSYNRKNIGSVIAVHLLPPHVMPIDIVNTTCSLSVYNVVGVWFSRVEISFNKVWTQNNACMTSSNQPSNWNNNREKMVMVIQLVLIGPFQLILGRSKSVCLRLIRHSYLSQYCMKMYKTYIYISKFKLNIVEYTVTYLSVIALDFESWWIKLSYFFFPTRYTKYLLIILNMQVFASSAIHHFKRPRKCFCNNM